MSARKVAPAAMLAQLPPDLARIDADSREKWSVAAYAVLSEQLSDDGLLLLIAAGRQKFIADAKLAFKRQDFRDDDYERIWQLLRRRAKGLERRQAAEIEIFRG